MQYESNFGDQLVAPQRLLAWDAMKVEAGGTEYFVRWTFWEQHTVCTIAWKDWEGVIRKVGGIAIRKPGDPFDPLEAAKVSARRTCGIRTWGYSAYHLPHVYSAIRSRLRAYGLNEEVSNAIHCAPKGPSLPLVQQ